MLQLNSTQRRELRALIAGLNLPGGVELAA